MQAQVSTIIGRNKQNEILPATSGDFTLADTVSVPARRILDEPGWSPYCFDPEIRELTFTWLPPDVDLAKAPFYFIEQYHKAQRFLSLPLDEVHDLAAGLVDPSLIFIFSMGRCGTTLANHALNGATGVWSLSEPDVTFGLTLRKLTGVALPQLLRDCCRLLHASRFDKTATTIGLKFRSQTLFAGEEFFAARPDAKYVFMYRDALSWADSFLQFVLDIGFTLPLPPPARDISWRMLSGAAPLQELGRYLDLNAPFADAERIIAAGWLRHLRSYMDLYEAGVPFLALRYNELVKDRQGELARLFRHCDLPEADVAKALGAFDEDSQKGTIVGQKSGKRKFGPDEIGTIRSILAGSGRFADPDLILPDVYTSRAAIQPVS